MRARPPAAALLALLLLVLGACMEGRNDVAAADGASAPAAADGTGSYTPVTEPAVGEPGIDADPARPAIGGAGARPPPSRGTDASAAPRLFLLAGRVEISLDDENRVPADYVLVRLGSGNVTLGEAWTTQDGSFFFPDVPPGQYELEVLASPKDPGAVVRERVVVDAGIERRPVQVRIPVEAIRGTRGALVLVRMD